MRTDILIPLKRLDAAKSRLAPALSVAERSRLMAAMVAHVARTALAADAGRVVLVSSDPAAPELAGRLGIGCVSDAGLPWNPGLAHARAQLPAPAGAVLYLAGDLPLVEVADVAALLDAGHDGTAVIGRAHDGGTNALWVCPAAALEPAFGTPESAAVHAARARGVPASRWSCSTGRGSPAMSTRPPISRLPAACFGARPASSEEVVGGVAHEVAARAVPLGAVPADERGRHPLELADHEVGGRRQLVGHRDGRRAQLVPGRVDRTRRSCAAPPGR